MPIIPAAFSAHSRSPCNVGQPHLLSPIRYHSQEHCDDDDIAVMPGPSRPSDTFTLSGPVNPDFTPLIYHSRHTSRSNTPFPSTQGQNTPSWEFSSRRPSLSMPGNAVPQTIANANHETLLKFQNQAYLGLRDAYMRQKMEIHALNAREQILKNLFAKDWLKTHEGESREQFQSAWEALESAERKMYEDRSAATIAALKTEKAAAKRAEKAAKVSGKKKAGQVTLPASAGTKKVLGSIQV
ncbi:hypothetical protein BKA93DRAFT_129306 [Sparassis latifolia]